MTYDPKIAEGHFRNNREHPRWENIKHIRRQRDLNMKKYEQIISTGPSYDIKNDLPPVAWAFEVERLKEIVDHIDQYKGQAAGPDGIRWEGVFRADRYKICHVVHDVVTDGTYKPSPIRNVTIPKSNGGSRTLKIGNIADRLVATVISQILTSLVDKHFVSTSYAYRPELGVYDLLAQLAYAVEQEHKYYYFSEDFKNAFDNVPINGILTGLPQVGVVPANVPGEESEQQDGIVAQWENLIEVVLRGYNEQTVGISQGCPLSPVAMNIFAHLNHDQVCQEIAPGVSALRYCDDMIYLGDSTDQLADFRSRIEERINNLGLSFKGGNHSQSTNQPLNIVDTPVEILGYVITMSTDSNLRFEIPESGFTKLIERLREAHSNSNPIAPGNLLLQGWIKAHGPALSPSCRDVMGERILNSLKELYLEDSMSLESCHKLMQDSYSAWEQKRQKLFTRLGTPTVLQTPQGTTTISSTLPKTTPAPQRLIFDHHDSCPF